VHAKPGQHTWVEGVAAQERATVRHVVDTVETGAEGALRVELLAELVQTS